jgi:Acetyltransferase (GNAT) domain
VLTLERVDADACDWEHMEALPDREIFQTREWLAYVAETQHAEPVVAAVLDGGAHVGWFTGLIVRRFGVRILGSPFPGWTTDWMGFSLAEGVPRREAAAALAGFAFGPLRCMHMELRDRRLAAGDLAGLGFEIEDRLTYLIDLDPDHDAMLRRMRHNARWSIKKAAKIGVVVEAASGLAFADEYYAQLCDVFAKQSLVPTYGVERVRALIRHLEPTGRLLLLRAIGPDGTPLATGIFPAFNGTAYCWGGASWRAGHRNQPNEPLFWAAMRYWQERGMTVLDTGGAGDYKRKYGTRELWVPWARRSRVPGALALRGLARDAVRRRQAWRGRRVAGASR